MSELTRQQLTEAADKAWNDHEQIWQDKYRQLQAELTKAQGIAEMRGQAILTLTEKWSERRAYHRMQFKKVVEIKRDLTERVTTLEGALKEVVELSPGGSLRISSGIWERCKQALAADHIPDVGKKVCIWSADGGDDWSTGCGRYFTLNDGQTPEDCAMKFCYHCGKPLEQILEEDITEGTR